MAKLASLRVARPFGGQHGLDSNIPGRAVKVANMLQCGTNIQCKAYKGSNRYPGL